MIDSKIKKIEAKIFVLEHAASWIGDISSGIALTDIMSDDEGEADKFKVKAGKDLEKELQKKADKLKETLIVKEIR